MDGLPKIRAPLKSRRSKPLTQDEEFEQIRRCRYIRKAPHQQSVEDVDLDISFLKNESESYEMFNKKNNNVVTRELSDTEEEITEVKTKNDSTTKKKDGGVKTKPELQRLPAIQPFTPHLKQSALNRDNMEPLRVQFSDKCTISSASRHTEVSVTSLRRSRSPPKVQQLYKDIAAAAKNANVDLATVSRDTIASRKSRKQRLIEQGQKKWTFLRSLVRTGLLHRKTGRSLRLVEARKMKEMLKAIDTPTMIARAKRADTPIHNSYIKRKMMSNKLPPLNSSKR